MERTRMGNQERGRLRRFGVALLMTGLLMSIVTTHRAEGSVISPEIDRNPVYYSTSGTIGAEETATVKYVEFKGVEPGSGTTAPAGVFYTPGTFSLGAFQVSALSSEEQAIYKDTPFSILLNLFADPHSGPVVSQFQIDGQLNGELSNGPGLGLLASVDSVTQVGTPIGTPPFRLEDLRILAPQFILPADGSSPVVSTPIFGYVDAQVPEPTALVTLGLGVALYLVRRSRRQRSRAERGKRG